MFAFSGKIESSKSWMNRALVIQHYNPLLEVSGQSASEDVLHLQNALLALKENRSEFFVGDGGTTFRFLALMLSRKAGVWTIRTSERLLQRPHSELKKIFEQLSVSIFFEKDNVIIRSAGWKIPPKIMCSADVSSQFVTGLLLNCWQLPSDVVVEIKKPIVSEKYLLMSVEMLKRVGMQLQITDTDEVLVCKILRSQIPKSVNPLVAEPDMSSAFALAAAAVVAGQAKLENWPQSSLQPDFIFLEVLKIMNICFDLSLGTLQIKKHQHWAALEFDLKNTPDLFPVLSVLCALAQGVSYLYGAENLKSKESDRMTKTIQLLKVCGYKTEMRNGGLVIYGQSSKIDHQQSLDFDPDQDHRMAMAAGIFKLSGYNITIKNPEVVRKSYPAFWEDIQVLK